MNSNKDAAEEREIFLQAMDLESGPAREEFVEKACAGNPARLARLEALLRSNEEATKFFEEQHVSQVRQVTDDITEYPAMRIGRYRLLERLGEGGCGVVFMAEQEEPVRRRVALKVIKAGMDSRAIVARFEAERQALAMMDHPNIAKVFDGGTTEHGRPYFVMELVRGTPITAFCERENLSVEQRVQLFVGVCQAVQHAHQKGIIHRDLKPSNVLVAVHDDHPVPKVIDFGIAKALEGALTERLHFTAHNQFIGTPAYMSPEQAGISDLDVDTRSDIYTLGVLLYELLTGVTPLDAKVLFAKGLDAMRQAIEELEPVPPSTRLLELRRASSLRSEKTTLESGMLAKDLDCIVMKCLEKQRSRRYETASSLAADLQRHLANEPIIARPPTVGYRLVKAVRRHRLVFAAGTLIVLSLLVGLTLAGWMYLKQRQALAQEQAALKQVRFEKNRADAAAQESDKASARATEEKKQAVSNLVKVREADGWRLAKEGDYFGALDAFAEVLRLEAHDPARAALHRQRLASVLRSCPRLNNVWSAGPGLTWTVFSKDGQKLLTANTLSPTQAIAQIRDASTGRALTAPMSHAGPISSVYWNADETRLVTASLDRTARVWDARTGMPLTLPLVHEGPVTFASMDTKGERVVTRSEDSSAELFATVWSVEGAQIIWRNNINDQLKYAPILFVAKDTEILELTRRLDARTGTEIGIVPLESCCIALHLPITQDSNSSSDLPSPTERPNEGCIEQDPRSGLIFLHNPAFKPKGSVLTSSSKSFEISSRWSGVISPNRAAFSEGKFATADLGGVAVYDFHATRDLKGVTVYETTAKPVFSKAIGGVSAMAFATFGRFLAVGLSDGRVQAYDLGPSAWNMAEGEENISPLFAALPHASPILSVSIHDDGSRVRAVCEDGTVAEWSRAELDVPRITLGSSKFETVEALTSSGRMLTGRFMRRDAWESWQTPGFKWSPIWSLADGSRLNWVTIEASSDFGDEVHLFNENALVRYTQNDVFITSLADGRTNTFSIADASRSSRNPDNFVSDSGKLVASGYNAGKEIRAFDVRTGKLVTTFQTQEPVGRLLPTLDHSRFLTVETNGFAGLWDLESGQRLSSAMWVYDDFNPQRFSADGKQLLVVRTQSGTLEILDDQLRSVRSVRFERLPWRIDSFEESSQFELSPNLLFVCLRRFGKPILIPTLNGSSAYSLNQEGVTSVCFSPDSRILATSGADGLIRFWDTSTGSEAWLPVSTKGPSRGLWFTPGGEGLVVQKFDRIEVWDLKPTDRSNEEWVRIAGFFSHEPRVGLSLELSARRSGQTTAMKSGGNQAESGGMAQRWNVLQRSLSKPLFLSQDISLSRLQSNAMTKEKDEDWEGAFDSLGSLILRDPDNVHLRYRRAAAAVRSSAPGKNSGFMRTKYEARLRQSLEDLEFVSMNVQCLESSRVEVRRALLRMRAVPLALLGQNDVAEQYQVDGLGVPKLTANRDPNWVNLVPWFASSLSGFGSSKDKMTATDGIRFDVRGQIHLASGILDEPEEFNREVVDIPIHRNFKRAHCLVGAGNLQGRRSGDRTIVGRLVFRYSDDSAATLELRIGDDIFEESTEESGMTSPRNSRLAVYCAQGTEDSRRCLRAFHRTWDNPRPDVEVISVDFVSAMNSVVPYLYAITLEP